MTQSLGLPISVNTDDTDLIYTPQNFTHFGEGGKVRWAGGQKGVGR